MGSGWILIQRALMSARFSAKLSANFNYVENSFLGYCSVGENVELFFRYMYLSITSAFFLKMRAQDGIELADEI